MNIGSAGVLAEKINKGADTGTHRPVAVINGAERHIYRQTLRRQHFDQLAAGNFLIDHIIRQTGDTVAVEAQLLKRFPAIG